MNTVKANWHEAVLPHDESDPFAAGQEQFDALAEPILLTDVPTLNKRLSALAQRQNELMAQGTDCSLRWKDGVTCSACPIAGRYGELCEAAAETERVTTELAIARAAPG